MGTEPTLLQTAHLLNTMAVPRNSAHKSYEQNCCQLWVYFSNMAMSKIDVFEQYFKQVQDFGL